MDEYFCPNCGAILNDQYGFDPSCGTWTCTSCGQTLMDDGTYNGTLYDGVAWYCDGCGALLNRQTGFSDIYGSWICTECGHNNVIAESEIYESQEEYEKESDNSDEPTIFTSLSHILADIIISAISDGATDCSKEEQECEDEVAYEEEEQEYEDKATSEDEARLCEEDAAREAEAERIRKEKTKERRAKNALRIKRAIAFVFNRKKIRIHYNCDDLTGKNVSFVVSALINNAFSNVRTAAIRDVYKDSVYRVGQVEQVVVGSSSFFWKDDLIPYDSEIIITYHDKLEITIPFSERSVRKNNYAVAYDMLQKLGFTEIHVKPIPDLTTGWLKKDGAIEKIVIGGMQSFAKNSVFPYDITITIEYHTFKK